MITDLRTGALSGGGGEQARVMADLFKLLNIITYVILVLLARLIVKYLMRKVVMKRELVF